MNDSESGEMPLGQVKALPPAEAGLSFEPGCYYCAIYFFPQPKCAAFPKEGDVMGLLWRYENEPDHWRFTFRYRYYAGPDVWDKKDRKSWWACLFDCSEQEADKKMEFLFALFRKVHGADQRIDDWPNMERFVIKGDWKKANRMLLGRQRPKWLHLKDK